MKVIIIVISFLLSPRRPIYNLNENLHILKQDGYMSGNITHIKTFQIKRTSFLIWCNKSKCLLHRIFCFYCSTKFDKYNQRCGVKISKDLNSSFKKDTYVWIHKPILVNNADVIKKVDKELSIKKQKKKLNRKLKNIF